MKVTKVDKSVRKSIKRVFSHFCAVLSLLLGLPDSSTPGALTRPVRHPAERRILVIPPAGWVRKLAELDSKPACSGVTRRVDKSGKSDDSEGYLARA